MCYFVFSDNHWIQQDSCNRKAIQALVHKLVSCFLSYLSCFHFLIQYLTGPLQNPEKLLLSANESQSATRATYAQNAGNGVSETKILHSEIFNFEWDG